MGRNRFAAGALYCDAGASWRRNPRSVCAIENASVHDRRQVQDRNLEREFTGPGPANQTGAGFGTRGVSTVAARLSTELPIESSKFNVTL